MKRILVPSDLSDLSENALKMAVDIAARTSAEIFLVNFIKHPLGKTFSATGEIKKKYAEEENLFTVQLVRKNYERLGELAQKYSSDSVEVNFQVYDEDYDDGIDKYIKEENIDLVMIGTTGESTAKEYFTGNHTEHLIENATCPVISIKDAYLGSDFKTIALGIDLEQDRHDNFSQAAAYINDLSSSLGATLNLVHVADSGDDKAAIEGKLNEFALKYGFTNYSVHVTENDEKDEGLMAYALGTGASLLAVLTHAEDGFFRIFNKSTAEDLAKESHVPVLTINLHNI